MTELSHFKREILHSAITVRGNKKKGMVDDGAVRLRGKRKSIAELQNSTHLYMKIK
ncbi:27457_t:CDS:2, partial [Racocetra persica]